MSVGFAVKNPTLSCPRTTLALSQSTSYYTQTLQEITSISHLPRQACHSTSIHFLHKPVKHKIKIMLPEDTWTSSYYIKNIVLYGFLPYLLGFFFFQSRRKGWIYRTKNSMSRTQISFSCGLLKYDIITNVLSYYADI